MWYFCVYDEYESFHGYEFNDIGENFEFSFCVNSFIDDPQPQPHCPPGCCPGMPGEPCNIGHQSCPPGCCEC